MIVRRRGVRLYKPYYQTIKRITDLLLCFLAVPFLLPVGLMVALAIRRDSQGPIFFEQERVGKGGRLFKIIKFRTMYYDIDDGGHRTYMREYINGRIQNNGTEQLFKPFKPSQVTRVGRILRKTSLDELPQLINVFKGEMSLVGPRPNVPWEVDAYKGWHIERLEVLPGITGLAQVKGRSGIAFDQIVRYDVEYIEKQSFMLDLQILWWTLSSVLAGNGAE